MSKADSGELLYGQKIKSLIEDYSFEKRKRGIFTYQMGTIAMQNKAKTSLERATLFSEKIRQLLLS